MGGAPSHSRAGPVRLLLLRANRSGGREGWVGKARHSHAAPGSRANGGEGAKGGCAPIRGLRAAPCSRAAVACNGGGGKGGGAAPFLFPCKGWARPSPSLRGYPFTRAPLPLRAIGSGNGGAHLPFLRPHFCAKGGEGRDEEERVGGAKCRKEGSKSQKRWEDRGGRDWGTIRLRGGQRRVDGPERCTHS